jgi:hypothetical protein
LYDRIGNANPRRLFLSRGVHVCGRTSPDPIHPAPAYDPSRRGSSACSLQPAAAAVLCRPCVPWWKTGHRARAVVAWRRAGRRARPTQATTLQLPAGLRRGARLIARWSQAPPSSSVAPIGRPFLFSVRAGRYAVRAADRTQPRVRASSHVHAAARIYGARSTHPIELHICRGRHGAREVTPLNK